MKSASGKFKGTSEAAICNIVAGDTCPLEERLVAMAVAVSTEPMKRLPVLYLRLRRVDNDAGSRVKKFVFRGLRFPVFYLHYFLGQGVPLALNFLIARAERRATLLERKNDALKLDRLNGDCLRYFRLVYECQEFGHLLDGTGSRREFSEHDIFLLDDCRAKPPNV